MSNDGVLQEIEALMPRCPLHAHNLRVDQSRPEFVAKCRLKECEYGILKAQPGLVQDSRFAEISTEEWRKDMSFVECFPLESQNIVRGWEKELTARHCVTSLALLSEPDLESFRYTSNVHVETAAYQLLKAKFYNAKGISFALRIGPGQSCPFVEKADGEL